MKVQLDFMKYRRFYYLVSLAVIVAGLISLAVRGLNLGIDFTGGNLLQVEFNKPVAIEQVRQVLGEARLHSFRVQQSEANQFLVRTSELTEAESESLVNTLKQKLGELKVLRNEKVGAVIGRELTLNAIWALLIGWALMLAYISVRFQFYFGLAALLALVHDVLVTLGFFSLFQIEVDSAFVAAILTLIGYSINDTIVIFDRIRESLKLMRKAPLPEIINYSLNVSLVRTITTSATVIIVLVCLLVLGGQTTKGFALALLVGTITGTYSSDCIASPLYYEFQQRWGQRRRPATRTA
ncbi:MAG: protein translocase subunit SecF [Moorellales bacterium]